MEDLKDFSKENFELKAQVQSYQERQKEMTERKENEESDKCMALELRIQELLREITRLEG